jgi:hypothetical protein
MLRSLRRDAAMYALEIRINYLKQVIPGTGGEHTVPGSPHVFYR